MNDERNKNVEQSLTVADGQTLIRSNTVAARGLDLLKSITPPVVTRCSEDEQIGSYKSGGLMKSPNL